MLDFGTMKLTAGLCVGAVMLATPVNADPAKDAAAVRAQFTQEQWSALQSVRFTPLVLPAYVPAGFRVSGVRLNAPWHAKDNPLAELFTVTYARGTDTISWQLTNYTGGGDAPPKQFQYVYHSPVIGDGVVRTDDAGCWYTDNLTGPNNGLFGTQSGGFAQFFFSLSCKGRAAPGELARMAQSVVLVRRGTVVGYLMRGPATETILAAPAGRDVQLFGSADVACGNPKVQDHRRSGLPATTSAKAGTHVYRLGFSYNCQGQSATFARGGDGTWVPIGVPINGWLDVWYVRSTDFRKK